MLRILAIIFFLKPTRNILKELKSDFYDVCFLNLASQKKHGLQEKKKENLIDTQQIFLTGETA